MNRNLMTIVTVGAALTMGGCAAEQAGDTPSPAKITGVPVFEVDASWPKLPPKWKLGDASSIAIDAQDNVWVLSRPRTLKPGEPAAPAVLIFDPAGNFVRSWAPSGGGFEWPEREHGIHIDYQGNVWVGGNNCPELDLPGLKSTADDQLVKFTQDGKLLMQIGKSGQSKGNADTLNLHRPADAWVYRKTNEVFAADGYGNQRVAVFDAETGKFKRMWGAFGKKPAEQSPCATPKPRKPSDPGPQNFSTVHAIRVANDGTVYVADRENQRVQVFTSEGRFVKQYVRVNAPFGRNLALSPDPDQQFLYVGAGAEIVVMDRRTLEIVALVGGPGFLGGGHQIATDSKGNLYVAATNRGLQKLAFKGMKPAPAK